VIKPYEWDTEGTVTPDTYMCGIDPQKDYSRIGQRKWIFEEFYFENQMRKKRNTPLLQEFLTDSGSASREESEENCRRFAT
jgi:hypothetical protein